MDIVLQLTYDEAANIEYLLRSYQGGNTPLRSLLNKEVVEGTLTKVSTALDDIDVGREEE